MRVQRLLEQGQDASEPLAFCQFLLDIGEGKHTKHIDPNDNSTDNFQIPDDMTVRTDERGLINTVYPSIKSSSEGISDRAILATTNKTCDLLTDY